MANSSCLLPRVSNKANRNRYATEQNPEQMNSFNMLLHNRSILPVGDKFLMALILRGSVPAVL
jgi:hypothetical protein